MVAPEYWIQSESHDVIQEMADTFALADAARRFVTLEAELTTDWRPDAGRVTAFLAAGHDMRLLGGAPCGCDKGTCPGVIG